MSSQSEIEDEFSAGSEGEGEKCNVLPSASYHHNSIQDVPRIPLFPSHSLLAVASSSHPQQVSVPRTTPAPGGKLTTQKHPGAPTQDPENEVDFRKAYSRLASAMSARGLVPENALPISSARGSVSSIPQFQERAAIHAENARKWAAEARELKERQEMQECTFNPRTTTQGDRRKLDEFLKDQRMFEERKKENLTRLSSDTRSKIESSVVQRPRIDCRSKQLAERRQDSAAPVHERLFACSKKHLKVQTEDENHENSGKKTARTRTGREVALYNDAKRRQEKLARMQKGETKPVHNTVSTDPYVIQRFTKEFARALCEIGVTIPEATMLGFDQTSIFPGSNNK